MSDQGECGFFWWFGVAGGGWRAVLVGFLVGMGTLAPFLRLCRWIPVPGLLRLPAKAGACVFALMVNQVGWA
jgi:hypothetical protein